MGIDLPPNWEQMEAEYNKDYDPHADICPNCGAEESFDWSDDYEDEIDETIQRYTCQKCGYSED